MSGSGGMMSVPELLQQMALWNWLNCEDEDSKQLLKAVTGVRVAHSLYRRLTQQDTIDLYKVMRKAVRLKGNGRMGTGRV
ncbi:hypothetical protein chiPu_0022903 [Chiloscyllium punctatum]|uniref:Uncharacterized protein n=1 Tax=Chiloscyllium punctatum TaxID=137246 RepID=A0A401T8F1_CHIPU|nr:hypothetical protein [Chiloscyllium punctatum]